ncbi:MAG: ABC-F family ATP-binding cassette domain-containing protein [Lachnospiraceae bacterium]|nr:ABC-F family ATP-binding cassette domain-containing protein [Lachnospiraceae bacterium]
MITIDQLSFSFPQKDLFQNISFTIQSKEHCALIGSSGCGKSTLCQILLHREDFLYDGKIDFPINSRIGYVSQFSQFDLNSTQTVYEYIAHHFVQLQQDIHHICELLETAEEMDQLLEDYQTKLELFQLMDGDHFEINIDKKLHEADLYRHKDHLISTLSGGEYKLVQIIREMLLLPQLMIMDEPDGFLDFENMNALRTLINHYQGALLVVTHNRYLLHQCFNKILHLENEDLQEFEGNYLEYSFTLLAQKLEKMELAQADNEEIERNEAVIQRLRAIATINADASRGRALHARVSLMARLEERRVKEPFLDIVIPEIRLPEVEVDADQTFLEITDYNKSFDTALLEHISFHLKQNEKIALIGANGTGKTTLLRDIYHTKQDSIQISPDARIGFLSQTAGETLDENSTILNEFLSKELSTNRAVKEYLAKYGFTKDLSQKIQTLSGGEKNLLQLAKIGLSNANFLLLDEPTSHLDTKTQLAFEAAVRNYKGAVFMVSHDFYTIANCMDYCLIIEDHSIRKIRIRKFRQMIYQHHFNKDYLELEQKRVQLEFQVHQAINSRNFDSARLLLEQLELIIDKL